MTTVSQATLEQPDWSTWRQMVEATLHDAVALSCNIAPRAVRGDPKTTLKEFFKRMEVATNHAASGSFPVTSRGPLFGQSNLVPLRDFGSWAVRQGWSIPGEFPLRPTDEPIPGKVWPWGTRETNLLRQLAAAAAMHWAEYDPLHPATAPTNKEVEEWLIGRQVPQRKAAVMAQMLRPDDLPAGPHVNRGRK